MAKAVKLADIAGRLGVSVVTVSKALSGQKGVSEEMRERIKALADELGYVQPSGNRRKRDEKSYNIGILIEESYLEKYASFYWQMYQQVTTFALERSSFTILEVITKPVEYALDLPKVITEERVNSIVVIGQLSTEYLRMLTQSTSLPIVYMDFSDGQQDVDAVVSDSFYGAYYLTNYLFSMGHRDIAYVGTLLSTGSITDRYLGYHKCMLEHGATPREEWRIDDRHHDNGEIDDKNLLQLPKEMPSAFFCNCDLTAGKLINKLQSLGYRVPEDISVVGYDNYIYPGLCDVRITTYEVDFKEMAKRVVTILLSKLNHEVYAKGVHIVEGHVVIKDSVKKLD